MDPNEPQYESTTAQPAIPPSSSSQASHPVPPGDGGGFTPAQRNTLVAIGTIVGIMLAVLAVVLITGGGDDNTDLATDDGITDPSLLGDGTTTGTDGTGTGSSTSSSVEDPTTTTESTSTSSTLSSACRNSYNSECGTFVWDPDPGANSPLRIEVDVIPENPKRGDEVSFLVRVTDDDAEIQTDCNVVVNYGDGDSEPRCMSEPQCAAPYGPHTPPQKKADFYQATFKHRYTQDGAYTVRFGFRSGGFCDDPYASEATLEIIVRVDPTLLPAT